MINNKGWIILQNKSNFHRKQKSADPPSSSPTRILLNVILYCFLNHLVNSCISPFIINWMHSHSILMAIIRAVDCIYVYSLLFSPLKQYKSRMSNRGWISRTFPPPMRRSGVCTIVLFVNNIIIHIYYKPATRILENPLFHSCRESPRRAPGRFPSRWRRQWWRFGLVLFATRQANDFYFHKAMTAGVMGNKSEAMHTRISLYIEIWHMGSSRKTGKSSSNFSNGFPGPVCFSLSLCTGPSHHGLSDSL